MCIRDREWTEHGLAPFMSVIAGQEMGSKAQHVRAAAMGKYADAEHVLLIGDAPGDRDAAREAGCLYYPINPGHEAVSYTHLDVYKRQGRWGPWFRSAAARRAWRWSGA